MSRRFNSYNFFNPTKEVVVAENKILPQLDGRNLTNLPSSLVTKTTFTDYLSQPGENVVALRNCEIALPPVQDGVSQIISTAFQANKVEVFSQDGSFILFDSASTSSSQVSINKNLGKLEVLGIEDSSSFGLSSTLVFFSSHIWSKWLASSNAIPLWSYKIAGRNSSFFSTSTPTIYSTKYYRTDLQSPDFSKAEFFSRASSSSTLSEDFYAENCKLEDFYVTSGVEKTYYSLVRHRVNGVDSLGNSGEDVRYGYMKPTGNSVSLTYNGEDASAIELESWDGKFKIWCSKSEYETSQPSTIICSLVPPRKEVDEHGEEHLIDNTPYGEDGKPEILISKISEKLLQITLPEIGEVLMSCFLEPNPDGYVFGTKKTSLKVWRSSNGSYLFSNQQEGNSPNSVWFGKSEALLGTGGKIPSQNDDGSVTVQIPSSVWLVVSADLKQDGTISSLTERVEKLEKELEGISSEVGTEV